jgi:C4-dicarboxylate-specific signal transduction histidine kinase
VSLQTIIIGTTFFIGVLMALCGVIAIFKKLQPGSGSFKFLGAEISGTGGILMLLVSLVLLMSGFGWASSHSQTVACAKDKTEVVAAAQQVHQQLQQEVALRQKLVQQQIEAQDPRLLRINPVTLPPRLAMEISHMGNQPMPVHP